MGSVDPARIDPFRLLLNQLSGELMHDNLKSLVHICGKHIPAGQREQISCGWDLFSLLRQQNMIGGEPKQIVYLLRIIQQMTPGRKDLVDKVKGYIECTYEESEKQMIFNDVESIPKIPSRQLPSSQPASAECCNVRCGCFSCNCDPCCSGSCCCLIVAILMIFFGVTAALLWYTNVFPDVSKHLNSISNENLAHAGWVIFGALGFVAICCISCCIYIRRRSRIDNSAESVERLADADVESVDSAFDNTASNSYASLSSARTA